VCDVFFSSSPWCFGCSCALSNLKKVSLELGGKSPLIIFSDCDMDKAVRMVRLPVCLPCVCVCVCVCRPGYGAKAELIMNSSSTTGTVANVRSCVSVPTARRA